MGTTSLEFDDLIVTGLCMTKADLDQWQLELPPRLRLKVADVINAPNWSELTDEEIMKGTVASTSAATLNGWSLRFGVLGILAIIFGGVLGYLVESSTWSYLGWIVAAISIGLAFFLPNHQENGLAAAFGMAPSSANPSWRVNWLRNQMMICALVTATGRFGLALFFIFLLWLLYRIDQVAMPANDTVVTALWRLAVISLIAIVIWLVWSGWHRSFFFQLARRVRGFLAWRLPPFWTSWLYEAKSRRPKPDVAISTTTTTTTTTAALDQLPVLAIALVCAVCVGKTHWFELFLEFGKNHDAKGKAGLFVLISRWMFQRPVSTLFFCSVLGSLAIATCTHSLVKISHPLIARRIATVAFAVALFAFALLAAVRN